MTYRQMYGYSPDLEVTFSTGQQGVKKRFPELSLNLLYQVLTHKITPEIDVCW